MILLSFSVPEKGKKNPLHLSHNKEYVKQYLFKSHCSKESSGSFFPKIKIPIGLIASLPLTASGEQRALTRDFFLKRHIFLTPSSFLLMQSSPSRGPIENLL